MSKRDPLADLRRELQQESAERDRLLMERLRDELQNEDPAREWDQLRGITSTPQTEKMSPWPEWSEIWAALLARRVPHAVMSVVAAFAVVALFLPSQLYEARPQEKGGGLPLPRSLRINYWKTKLRLFERDDFLEGKLIKTSNGIGADGYSIDLRGHDNTGVTAHFNGVVWLTNSTPRTALIQGRFSIAGRSTNDVSQVYIFVRP